MLSDVDMVEVVLQDGDCIHAAGSLGEEQVTDGYRELEHELLRGGATHPVVVRLDVHR